MCHQRQSFFEQQFCLFHFDSLLFQVDHIIKIRLQITIMALRVTAKGHLYTGENCGYSIKHLPTQANHLGLYIGQQLKGLGQMSTALMRTCWAVVSRIDYKCGSTTAPWLLQLCPRCQMSFCTTTQIWCVMQIRNASKKSVYVEKARQRNELTQQDLWIDGPILMGLGPSGFWGETTRAEDPTRSQRGMGRSWMRQGNGTIIW